MEKNILNRKVFRLVSKNKGISFSPDKSKVYTILQVKDYDESGDWCRHYILKDRDDHAIEVREFEAIFIPDTSLDEVDMVNKYLSDNDAYPSEIHRLDGKIYILLEDSDWKHGHIWCDTLMRYLGYKKVGEVVTEEDGSDCYSAIHYFVKH